MAQPKQSSRHVCDVLKLKLPMRSSRLLLWLSSWDLRSSCISAKRRNRFSDPARCPKPFQNHIPSPRRSPQGKALRPEEELKCRSSGMSSNVLQRLQNPSFDHRWYRPRVNGASGFATLIAVAAVMLLLVARTAQNPRPAWSVPTVEVHTGTLERILRLTGQRSAKTA